MGSRVRIRLFQILHFVRDLLFPLLKNSKSGVDDRGHRLRINHTRRRLHDFPASQSNILKISLDSAHASTCSIRLVKLRGTDDFQRDNILNVPGQYLLFRDWS